MNILPLVMQYFGPVIVNKIAGSLGINSTLAQKAIAYAAPAILAGMVGKVAQPGGAKVLTDTIGKLDPSLLGKLGEMIGTGRQAPVVEQGSSLLGSLLGASTFGSLAGALSKQAGLGVGASNTLLGLMGPAVLGTLGKEQKKEGLDAAGLGNALMAQKKQIADAIPADFAKLLAGTGLLDAVQGKSSDTNGKTVTGATSASAAASTAARSSTAGAATPAAQHHHHHFNWWPWLLAIAAAFGLWWAVFGERVMQPQPTATIPAVVAPSTTLATSPALPAALAATDAGKQFAGLLDELRGTVAGVRDAATAQAALPRLQDMPAKIDGVGALAAKLGPEARAAFANYAGATQGPIKSAIATALTLPGVSNILKAVVEQIQARLANLAKV